MTPLRIAIVVLTLATAVIHVYWGIIQTPIVVPLLLNGVGYTTLVSALYLPLPRLKSLQPRVRWVLLGYTALTVLLWALVGPRVPIAYVDKVVELALILLLWLDARRARA